MLLIWFKTIPRSHSSETTTLIVPTLPITMATKCYYCRESPIRGTRYVFKDNYRYNCCSYCLPDKVDWRKAKDHAWYHWNKDSSSSSSSSYSSSSSSSSSDSGHESPVNCYYCKHTLRGSIYVFKQNQAYAACSACVPNKKEWRLVTRGMAAVIEDRLCTRCRHDVARFAYRKNRQHAVCNGCIRRYKIHEWVPLPIGIAIQYNNTGEHGQYGYVSHKECVKRFCVHKVPCNLCHKPRIHGLRYMHKKHPEYNLCSSCYYGDDHHNYHAIRKPWKHTVPRVTLSSDDYDVRDEVRHLQYLLTRLGFLAVHHTDKLVGSFQSHTAAAVEAFRKKYKIFGEDMRVYDRNTRRALRDVVRSL